MLAGKNRATPTASRLANLKVFAERIRVWAVYAALILILITLYFGGFLGPAKTYLLPASLVLVAAFVIQSIQAIEKSLAADEKPDSYPDMMAAVSALEDLIAADRDVTDLKIIAATGGTSVNLVLPRLCKKTTAKHMRINIHIIDTGGPFSDAYPGHWKHEAAATLDRIREQYVDPRFEVKVSTYRHLPALHGILVNDKSLLLGFFGWDTSGRTPQLTGAERQHRLYRRDDAASSQLFEIFEEWFRNAPQKTILELPIGAPITATSAD